MADWDDCHISFIPIMKKSILATLNNLLENKNNNKNHTEQPTNVWYAYNGSMFSSHVRSFIFANRQQTLSIKCKIMSSFVMQ